MSTQKHRKIGSSKQYCSSIMRELLNRNQLSNIIPNNSNGKAELSSVIILQLNLPNLQNLFTRTLVKNLPQGQYELVFSTHLNMMHPIHPVTFNTARQSKNFQERPSLKFP